MKLHLGCGGNLIRGWANHDSEVDISKPLPFGSASADEIFSEHCFEHVSPQEGFAFLEECRRVLVPGGRLRLCIPVLERLDVAHGRDIILGHGHRGVYTAESIKQMLRIAGFSGIIETGFREETDGHWRVIGQARDSVETCRVEAFNP